MAEALRRILWLIPLLGVGSVLLFALLASGLPHPAHARSIPLFFNPDPRGVRHHVTEALDALEQGEAPHAADQLARLGGSALPHVLPRLLELDAAAQRRIALALAPLARRTNVARNESVLDDPEGSVLFWKRFWQDRALDFQPNAVSRLVRRVSSRSQALGSTDLVQLDTYALPELVRKLGSVRTDQDVQRARRLLEVIGDITDRRWIVPAEASIEEARRTVTECRRWWDERRHLYVDISGTGRLAATIVQTRYGIWAIRTLREVMGVDTSVVGHDLRHGARTTLPLLLCCLLGAGLLAAPAAALSTALRAQRRLFRIAGAVAVALLIPASVLSPPQNWPKFSMGSAWMVSLALGAVPAWHLGQQALRGSSGDHPNQVTSWQASFATRLREFFRFLPIWLPVALAECVTLVFGLEWALGLHGLGPRTIEAIKAGELPWLMALCLGLGSTTALLQIAADLWLSPPIRSGSVPSYEGPSC